MTAVMSRPRPLPGPRPAATGPSAPAGPAAPSVAVRVIGPRRFRPDIQGLRAIAVLAVVLYHCGVPGIPGGYVGVDVFFVISGFLITGHLRRDVDTHGKVRFADFYMRRVRRLLPPALLVLIVVGPLGAAVLPLQQARSLFRDGIFAAGYALNYRLIDQAVDYQNASGPPSALQHFWSLAVEEQFYVVWPLLIAACAFAVRARAVRLAVITAVIVAITAGSLYLSVTVTPTDPTTAYFSLQTRAWELGLGALLALGAGVLARCPAVVARLAGFCGLALIVGAATSYDENTPYPGTAALLPVIGAVLVIAGGMHRVKSSAETVLLGHGSLQFIGRSSYAWYLWHWPMLILLAAWQGRALTLTERIVILIVSFWAAVLTYFLENAAQRSPWRPRRWLPVGLVASGLVAVMALGLAPLLHAATGDGRARVVTALTAPDISRVQRELTAALKVSKLPRNATPTPDGAPDDQPIGATNGCFADIEATTSKRCVIGDPAATRTAVLVGDSHAAQWATALDINARRAGWRIVELTKAACPVATLPFRRPNTTAPYTQCTAFWTSATAFTRSIRVDMVIAAESNIIAGPDVSPASWAEATRRGIERLTPRAVPTVLIGDTPTTRQDTTACLSQHVDDIQVCSYPRKDAYLDGFDTVPRYRALQKLAKQEGYGYVDTLNFFCNYAYCPAVVGNMVVHRDEGHVTNTYARWLAPMFRSIFEGRSR